MYQLLLRQLEQLQSELAVADPSDTTRTIDAVRTMAASLRRLDDRTTGVAQTRKRPRTGQRRVA